MWLKVIKHKTKHRRYGKWRRGQFSYRCLQLAHQNGQDHVRYLVPAVITTGIILLITTIFTIIRSYNNISSNFTVLVTLAASIGLIVHQHLQRELGNGLRLQKII